MTLMVTRRAAIGAPVPQTTAMPVGNLPGWTQVVAEDFNDDVPIGGFVPDAQTGLLTAAGSGYALYKDRFKSYKDGNLDTSNNGQYYASKTMSTHDSCLDIYMHTENISGTNVPLGGVVKPLLPSGLPKQTYGRYAYRMRATGVTGTNYGFVVLCIDSNNWPDNGEFDWPEGDISGGVGGFYHFANPSGGQQAVNTAALWSDWHTYVIEWKPNSLRWYIDGSLALNTPNQVPSGELGFLGQGCTTGGVPDPATVGHVQIDWMCVYTMDS